MPSSLNVRVLKDVTGTECDNTGLDQKSYVYTLTIFPSASSKRLTYRVPKKLGKGAEKGQQDLISQWQCLGDAPGIESEDWKDRTHYLVMGRKVPMAEKKEGHTSRERKFDPEFMPSTTDKSYSQ